MGPDAARPAPTYRLVRALLLRGVGVVFVIAFVSLWVQVDGLFGSLGIAPITELLEGAQDRLGAEALHRVPSLFWLGSSDAWLHVMCAAGTVLGALVALGVAPGLLVPALWALYLSFASAGSPFLDFQWDALLLETAFFSALYAWPQSTPSRVGLWLLRWLLFRLVFTSGLVKLLSGDETWSQLTALSYHYWTQPLPAWTSVFAAGLPAWIQSFSTAATLAIELLAPLGIFGPRPVRLAACALLVLLQCVIAATGSYGFFNLLTLVLCVSLLDDDALRALVPRRFRRPTESAREPAPRDDPPPPVRREAILRAAGIAGAALLVAITVVASSGRVAPALRLPAAVVRTMSWLGPFRTFNAYGLFAVMTTERPEIGVEGSQDGRAWREYVFRWKPGPLDRRPELAGPYMPRLDWQMWFAALGRCEHEAWLHAFLVRLLEGDPDVVALLASDPFSGAAPRLIRTTLWRYRFAPLEDRHLGVWWTRERVGPYCPTVTLDNGRLRAVEDFPADGEPRE